MANAHVSAIFGAVTCRGALGACIVLAVGAAVLCHCLRRSAVKSRAPAYSEVSVKLASNSPDPNSP